MNTCSHTEGPHHDCAYVNARNSLLTRAEELANKRAPDYPAVEWGALFLLIMDQLYRDGAHLELRDHE